MDHFLRLNIFRCTSMNMKNLEQNAFKVVKRCFVCLTMLLQKVRAAFCINSQLAPIWRLKNKHYRLIYLQSSCATIIFALACCAQAMEQLQTMTSVAETAWWKRIIRSQMSPSPLACKLFLQCGFEPNCSLCLLLFQPFMQSRCCGLSKFPHKSKFFTLC